MDKDELTMVRNYMSGELARGCDSPFSVADMYIGLLANGLPFDYYSRQAETIREITAEEILPRSSRTSGHLPFVCSHSRR